MPVLEFLPKFRTLFWRIFAENRDPKGRRVTTGPIWECPPGSESKNLSGLKF